MISSDITFFVNAVSDDFFCPAGAFYYFVKDEGLEGRLKGEEQPDAPEGHCVGGKGEPSPCADNSEESHDEVRYEHDATRVSCATK